MVATSAFAQNSAEEKMRPGLWAVTTTSEMLKLVPQMSAEQVQSVRDVARQYGIDLPQISQQGVTANICVTPEMAQKNIMPELNQRYAGCETNNANRFGNLYSVDISCNGEQVRGKGSASGVFSNAESFAGKSTFDGVVQGMPVVQQAETRGKWIAASCGSSSSGNSKDMGKSQNR